MKSLHITYYILSNEKYKKQNLITSQTKVPKL